ncbi:MAG: helix-turn-helix domain-containing protein [Candidatus Taylorbacteria bacterium]
MYTNEAEKTNGNSVPVRWPIHPVVLGVIGLTENEEAVLNALLTFQMGKDVAKVGRVAGLPRTTTLYTLKKLEKRGLAFTTLHGKRNWWRFKRGPDRLVVRDS